MKREDLFAVVSKSLLCVAAVSTTAYLLMLGWFNTLSLDDYGFVFDISTRSPWEWMRYMYMTWQGRFSCFVVSGYILEIWGRADSLISWTIVHLLIGYVIAYLYMRDVLKVKDKVSRCAIAVLVSNITIMSVFEISTFYWLCCAVYFLEIYLALLLFYVLFISRWRVWVNAIIAIICALYISGSAENFTPLVVMVLGIIWAALLVRDAKQSSLKETFCKHWLLFVVCAIIGIGFIAMVMAPGNTSRMQMEDGTTVGFMHHFDIVMFIKRTIVANVVFMLRVLSRSLYWIGIMPIFIYIGKLLQDKEMPILQVKLWKGIGGSTLMLLGFIFISVTACVYGMGYYPPLRSMSFIPYAIVVWLVYACCLIGYKIADKSGWLVKGLVIVSVIGWIIFSWYEFMKEYPEAKRYHDYVTQRNERIQQLVAEGNTETLYVDGFERPEWRNTYSYLRTAINKCVGSKKFVNEPYFPYMVAELNREESQIDFKSQGLSDYYDAKFEILEN